MTSGTQRTTNQGKLSKAALLMAGAVGAWLVAPTPEANATCNFVVGGGTLANMNAGSEVECAGTNSGVVIGSTTAAPEVEVLAGATFDASTMTFNAGASNAFVVFREGASADQSSFSFAGSGSIMSLEGATLTNSGSIILTGTNSQFLMFPGSVFPSITFANGSNLQLTGANSFIFVSGGVFGDTTSSAAAATLLGGAGVQEFQIQGAVTAGGNGVAIDMGFGDDILALFDLAQITGLVDGGAGGTDRLVLAGTNSQSFNSVDIEHLDMLTGGDWTLSGTHQFVQLNLTAGTLRAASTGALGNSNSVIILGSSGTLVWSNTGTYTFDHDLSGSGFFINYAGGDLVFNNANQFFTGTIVNDNGTLIVNNGGAFGSAAVVNHDVLRMGNVTIANNISGVGVIEKTSGGLGILTGTNTHTGGVDVIAGTLRADLDALGSGLLNIRAGARFELDLSGNVVMIPFAADIASTFAKQGAGTLTLTTGQFGNLEIEAGAIQLNGAITVAGAQGLTVESGGALTGFSVITGNVTNSGLVSPGPGIATLSIVGNYVHESTGVLEIEFDTAGSIDLLDITGTATINGGTLRLVSLGGADGAGLTFLHADGGVTGQFATLDIPAGGAAAVIYQTNDVEIAPTLVTARPTTANSQIALAGQSVGAFIDILNDEAREGQGRSLWARAIAASAERDAAGASLGYSFDSFGAAGGFRSTDRDGWSMGLAFASSSGDARLDQGVGATDIEGVLGAFSLDLNRDNVFAGAGLILGRQDFETDRVVVLNGAPSTMQGESEARSAAAYIMAGLRGELGGWQSWVSGRASYVHNAFDGYTEQGTNPVRVAVDDFETQTALLELEAGIERRITLDNGLTLTPHLRAGLSGDIALDDREVDITFPSSGQGGTLIADTSDRVLASLGAGVALDVSPNATLTADVRHLAGDDASDTYGSIGARLRF